MINYIIKSCQQLDASILEPHLHEDDTMQHLDKYRFLARMKRIFDDMIKVGHSYTVIKDGRYFLTYNDRIFQQYYDTEAKNFLFGTMIQLNKNTITDIHIYTKDKTLKG